MMTPSAHQSSKNSGWNRNCRIKYKDVIVVGDAVWFRYFCGTASAVCTSSGAHLGGSTTSITRPLSVRTTNLPSSTSVGGPVARNARPSICRFRKANRRLLPWWHQRGHPIAPTRWPPRPGKNQKLDGIVSIIYFELWNNARIPFDLAVSGSRFRFTELKQSL